MTSTTLAAALAADGLTASLASTSGLTAGMVVKIDGEYMVAVSVPVSGVVKLRSRGDQGTQALAHEITAPVVFGDAEDFLGVPAGGVNQKPPYLDDVVSLNEDQEITIPLKNTTFVINKATAAALTISPATADALPVVMTFIAATAQAHTLTYTEGFLGDTTSSDVVSFGSKVGATCQVKVGVAGLLSLTLGSGCTLA